MHTDPMGLDLRPSAPEYRLIDLEKLIFLSCFSHLKNGGKEFLPYEGNKNKDKLGKVPSGVLGTRE